MSTTTALDLNAIAAQVANATGKAVTRTATRPPRITDLAQWTEAADTALDDPEVADWLANHPGIPASALPATITLTSAQRAAILATLDNPQVVLGMKPGLGKTVTALAALACRPDVRRIAIVCPLNLIGHWTAEIGRYYPHLTVATFEGRAWSPKRPETDLLRPEVQAADVLLVRESIVAARAEHVVEHWSFDALVVDESQMFKTRGANRSQGVKLLATHLTDEWKNAGDPDALMPPVLALTGTVIDNTPVDLYHQLVIAGGDTRYARQLSGAGDYSGFVSSLFFTDTVNTPHGNIVKARSAKDPIGMHHDLISSCYVAPERRYQVQKSWNTFDLEIADGWTTYNRIEKEFVDWLHDTFDATDAVDAARISSALRAEALVKLGLLRQHAALVKADRLAELVAGIVTPARPVVVFGHHRKAVAKVRTSLATHKVEGGEDEYGDLIQRPIEAAMFGGTTGDKAAAIDDFLGGDADVFLANIDAAGVGLNLNLRHDGTPVRDLIFLQIPFSPGKLEQASDRIYRVNSPEDVTIHVPLATRPGGKVTVEHRISDALARKAQEADIIATGKGTEVRMTGGDESVLTDVMRSFY
jgi:hypothetical protein